MKEHNPKSRKPDWLKVRYRYSDKARHVKGLIQKYNLHTVCSSASCPNSGECWSRGTATFMIMGNVCTRDCRFCDVPHGTPLPVDHDEPRRVAQAVKKLNLKHAVITSVTRDDLPDGGASLFAITVQAIREVSPGTTIEILTPDFKGDKEALMKVINSHPHIFNHNLETVERLTPTVRPAADYRRSLTVLQYMSSHGEDLLVKSGLMLGLGETGEERMKTMRNLRSAGCQVLTLGQYLQPSKHHLPVAEYIHPDEFKLLETFGYELGFLHVFSGPLVRSSYMADQLHENLS